MKTIRYIALLLPLLLIMQSAIIAGVAASGIEQVDAKIMAQQVPWGISRVNAPTASAQVDETGIIVAVIDTGLDLNHEDLQGRFAWGYSWYRQGARSFWIFSPWITRAECTATNPGPCNDDHGHGTHVSGTIAAQDNNLGVLGVAPDVSLYVFKALASDGSGSYTAIAEAIVKATEGPDGVAGTTDDADVISMSLGGSSGNSALQNAVNFALSNGVVIVAATGNDGASSPSYPAAYSGVIKVGAVDSSNAIASWSNRGETILAPGVGVLSSTPGNSYDSWSGTSMATPHVAAIAALACAAHPGYSNAQIRQLVEGSADSYGVADANAVV